MYRMRYISILGPYYALPSAGGHAGVARPARPQPSEDVPGRLSGRKMGCAGGPRVGSAETARRSCHNEPAL